MIKVAFFFFLMKQNCAKNVMIEMYALRMRLESCQPYRYIFIIFLLRHLESLKFHFCNFENSQFYAIFIPPQIQIWVQT